MPYIKFDNPKGGTSNNKSSCTAFIEYLQKEDAELKENKEFLFNQRDDMVKSSDAIQVIDSNRQGLKKDDAKFYTGSINFSEEELRFIDNDYAKIKQYTVEFFKLYAANFNKDLTIDDINWFAKIEANRYYKGDDQEVIYGEVKQGEIKPGLNTHIHFIVGRKSVDGSKKLSPKTNHRNTDKGAVKGGFNRDQFKKDCERIFDNLFRYNRPLNEGYDYLKSAKKADSKTIQKNIREQSVRIKYDQLDKNEKIRKLEKLINHINKKCEEKSLGKRINKEEIIQNAKDNDLNGNVYKSLINVNFKIIEGEELPQDLNSFVIDYSSNLNRPFNKLPVSVKRDKIERYIYMLNRKVPKGNERISLDKVLQFEDKNNYSGKSFKVLNEVNRLLKAGNINQLSTMVNQINNSLENTIHVNYKQESQPASNEHKIMESKPESSKGSYLPLGGLYNFSYGPKEAEEEEKRKKKKKKKKRNNDFDRSF